MLKVEGINLEAPDFPQIGKEPSMGYADEYIEKTMISGLVKRIYRGKRFYATFTYAFLRPEQITIIKDLLGAQRHQGFLNVEISNPYGNYKGQAILELNSDQIRFKIDPKTGEGIWTNWQIHIKATAYDN